METGQPVPFSLYVYVPSKGAPIFFSISYALSAVGHLWQCYRYRSFRLIGLHPICALLFTLGYALRIYGAFDNYLYNTHTLIVFILSQVFIYICPPLLELANYHVLGRILYYVPYLAPLPPNKVLSTFGALMGLVETLNALGVSLSSNPSSSNQGLGSHLTITALSIQLVVIVIFLLLASIFHYRCVKTNIHTKNVMTPLYTLYGSMVLIFIRCIYRLVEHLGNTTVDLGDLESLSALSPILRYEWYFYVFEATLMLANSIIWNVWNPGRYLPRENHIYLSPDGRTEVEGEKEVDGRSLLAKAGSIMTFGIFFRKKQVQQSQHYRLNSFSSRGPILTRAD
ncbi:hypothetical protein BKA67DRAFT_10462 [Truncatella angustata]|uniref:RTA1 domain protein n=1 Tax=Truncatella angustata TaxID=152316 RepID=A0A9P8UWJ4_9PEZI|nr:uncharacterized protein BKA67DRAFT_10462 [Truncatella angustata]KAH6659316.1 hypothetical protein BKA67DRAFT_10462 [Truncatella angustata]